MFECNGGIEKQIIGSYPVYAKTALGPDNKTHIGFLIQNPRDQKDSRQIDITIEKEIADFSDVNNAYREFSEKVLEKILTIPAQLLGTLQYDDEQLKELVEWRSKLEATYTTPEPDQGATEAPSALDEVKLPVKYYTINTRLTADGQLNPEDLHRLIPIDGPTKTCDGLIQIEASECSGRITVGDCLDDGIIKIKPGEMAFVKVTPKVLESLRHGQLAERVALGQAIVHGIHITVCQPCLY